MAKRQLTPKPLEGKIIPFEAVREPWCEYTLADGNTLRVRINMIMVKKSDKKAPDGKPIYNFQSNLSIGIFTEEEGYVRPKR